MTCLCSTFAAAAKQRQTSLLWEQMGSHEACGAFSTDTHRVQFGRRSGQERFCLGSSEPSICNAGMTSLLCPAHILVFGHTGEDCRAERCCDTCFGSQAALFCPGRTFSLQSSRQQQLCSKAHHLSAHVLMYGQPLPCLLSDQQVLQCHDIFRWVLSCLTPTLTTGLGDLTHATEFMRAIQLYFID